MMYDLNAEVLISGTIRATEPYSGSTAYEIEVRMANRTFTYFWVPAEAIIGLYGEPVDLPEEDIDGRE